MTGHGHDKVFSGSIARLYESHLVPLIFEDYARDLAQRVCREPAGAVLEVAAGTGVVTRALVEAAGGDVSIVATDLNQAMLDHAASIQGAGDVTWQQADATELPFEEGTFDVVACQFGVMFFPDRARAYAEARRVLKPGGRFVFSTWDHIGENEFADTVTTSLAGIFPDDPPMFLARTPHGYADVDEVAADLAAGGFTAAPEIVTIAARSRAADPSVPAVAYCQGTPLRNEIESRDSSLLEHATQVATAALAERFGTGAVDGRIQAHVVSIRA